MPDFDLYAPASATTHHEYVITRHDGPPVELDESGGRSVALGITSGLAPLRAGETLFHRKVTITTTEWDDVDA
jgi:hypothetical protein